MNYKVNVDQLNLRSEPQVSTPPGKNITIVLDKGDTVRKIRSASETSTWWEVEVTIDNNNNNVKGFVNSLVEGKPTVVPANAFAPFSVVNNLNTPIHLEENNPKSTKSNRAKWKLPIGLQDRPERDMTSVASRKESIIEIVDYLDVENSGKYKRTIKDTYCNLYAYDYAYLCGVFLPRMWWRDNCVAELKNKKSVEFKETNLQEMRANDIFNWFENHSQLFDWQRLIPENSDYTEIQEAANSGKVVIISGYNKQGGHGHICAVVPETANNLAVREQNKVVRPLQSQAGGTNKKYFTTKPNWWGQGKLNSFKYNFGFWIHE